MGGRQIFLAVMIVLAGTGCGRGLELYRDRLIPASEPSVQDRVQVTWMGTAGVLVSDGTTRILIDPFVTRKGLGTILFRRFQPDDMLAAEWIERIGAQGTSAVIVSHTHYDHSMDAPNFAKRVGAVLVGSESTANVARGMGFPEEQLNVIRGGTELQLGRFRVVIRDSRHGPALFGRIPYPGEISAPLEQPAKASDYRLGAAYSILIEHPLGSILHHGSAGWLESTFAGIAADVVLLGVAGRDDTDEYLEHVVGAVGAKRLVPIHFDDFFEPLDNPLDELAGVKLAELIEAAEARGLSVETLPVGQPRVFFRGPAEPANAPATLTGPAE